MIQTPTVFVLGAGASMPYGFPSGSELVNKIINFDGVGDIKFDPEMRKQLRESDPSSIDAFLEHRREFISEGKRAIAYQLSQYELHGNLFSPNRDWYSHILDRMASGTPFDELKNNRIGFVTFNYDRSLEHYLFTAISRRYGKDSQVVADLLQHFPIIHVHGQIGFLPWQHADAKHHRAYTGGVTPSDVKIGANGIKIISENEANSPEFQAARTLIQQANRIGILGFGYHPLNMRRLELPIGARFVEGTCYGFTGPERDELMNIKHKGLISHSPDHKVLEYMRHSHIFREE